MEEREKAQKCGCGCRGWCGNSEHHHWHPGFFLLRILIAIVVVAFAFAVGVKLGELKAGIYYSAYGSNGYSPMQYMMGDSYGYGSYGGPMMRYYGGYGYGAQSPAAAPATSTGK